MSALPLLWRTRTRGVVMARLDLFETEAIANAIGGGPITPSAADLAEAQRVIATIHARGESIGCGCLGPDGDTPLMRPVLVDGKGHLRNVGPEHDLECPFRDRAAPARPKPIPASAPPLATDYPFNRPASFGLNNLTATI